VLEQKGYLELSGRARGIALTSASAVPRLRHVPVVGRVAAGRPLLASEHIEDQVAIAPQWFPQAPDFLLRVHGDSMRDAHILDGDWLAVRATPVAENGQIVVARLGEEATVKRYRRQGDVVTLFPANPDYQPIRIDLSTQSLAIEGIALGVIGRRL
jgi:repressor LexA